MLRIDFTWKGKRRTRVRRVAVTMVHIQGMPEETWMISMPQRQRPAGDQPARPRAARSPYWRGRGRVERTSVGRVEGSGRGVESRMDGGSMALVGEIVVEVSMGGSMGERVVGSGGEGVDSEATIGVSAGGELFLRRTKRMTGLG